MFFLRPYYLIFLIIAANGSLLLRGEAVDPFFTRFYAPFSDLMYPDREDILNGDSETGLDFIPMLNESYNLTSLEFEHQIQEAKVNNDETPITVRIEQMPQARILKAVSSSYNFHKVEEPSTKAQLIFNVKFADYEGDIKRPQDDKINLINIDDLETNQPTVSTTKGKILPSSSKPTQDIPDTLGYSINGFVNSIFNMIKGILDILFGLFPTETNKSEEKPSTLEEKYFIPTQKVYKRHIPDITMSTAKKDIIRDDDAQSSSESYLLSSHAKNYHFESSASSQEQQNTEKISQSKTDEAKQGQFDKKDSGDQSSTNLTDKVEELNTEQKTDLESTSEKLKSLQHVSFVNRAKESEPVKKNPPMFLDDEEDIKLMDDSNTINREGYDVKSSSFGEAVLVTVACVFFVVVFATAGTALAYAVRKQRFARDPIGNQYNPGQMHA